MQTRSLNSSVISKIDAESTTLTKQATPLRGLFQIPKIITAKGIEIEINRKKLQSNTRLNSASDYVSIRRKK